jgi:hypothetical protein
MTEEEKLKSLMNEKHRLEAQLDKVIMKIRALVYNFDKKIGFNPGNHANSFEYESDQAQTGKGKGSWDSLPK